MAPVGFEPTIAAGEQPQTYALYRAATLAVLVTVKNPVTNEHDDGWDPEKVWTL
jgi:hypothetical protein